MASIVKSGVRLFLYINGKNKEQISTGVEDLGKTRLENLFPENFWKRIYAFLYIGKKIIGKDDRSLRGSLLRAEKLDGKMREFTYRQRCASSV